MLARGQRLRRRRDIATVSRRGRAVSGRLLILQVYQTPGRPTRFVIVVSKRTAKRAVDRNRVKRQLRALLAALKLQRDGGWAILLRVRPPAIGQPSTVLRQELHALFSRQQLL